MIETTVLDFELSNTFQDYKAYMEAPEQQVMFSEIGVKIFLVFLRKTQKGQPSYFKGRKMFCMTFS